MCYWCGRLSHSDKNCELWIISNGSLTESDRQFGAWLCAPTYNTRKCSTVQVGGEEEVRSDGRGEEAVDKDDAVLGGWNEKGSRSEHDDSHRWKEREGVQTIARTETRAFSGPSIYEVRDHSSKPDFRIRYARLMLPFQNLTSQRWAQNRVGWDLLWTKPRPKAHQ